MAPPTAASSRAGPITSRKDIANGRSKVALRFVLRPTWSTDPSLNSVDAIINSLRSSLGIRSQAVRVRVSGLSCNWTQSLGATTSSTLLPRPVTRTKNEPSSRVKSSR